MYHISPFHSTTGLSRSLEAVVSVVWLTTSNSLAQVNLQNKLGVVGYVFVKKKMVE